MARSPSPLDSWTPAQIEDGRRWVAAWRSAAVELEKIRWEELRNIDVYKRIEQLLDVSPSLGTHPVRATSGLVEQQRWFMRARRNS